MAKVEKIFLMLFLDVILVLSMVAPLWASHRLVLEIQDYAKEGLYYYPLYFHIDIQNTGSERDTIDLYLTKAIPPGWFADFCVRGKCVTSYAYIDLAPGQRDSILVDIYLGGDQNVGSATLKGIVRGHPSEAESVTVVGFCAQPSMVLIDDDQGANHQTYLRDAIQYAGYKTYIYNTSQAGRPTATFLKSFWAVFWTTAGGDASYIGAGDEDALVEFLDCGGRLFFSSMNYLSSRNGTNALIWDYLGIASWTDDNSISGVSGVFGDPVSDGMNLQLGNLPFPANEVEFLVLRSSNAIFNAGGNVVGLRSSGNEWKVVFLSFPFEPIVNNPYPNNQTTFISRVIDWFDPFEASVKTDPREAEFKSAFPNPFRGTTTIVSNAALQNTFGRIYDTRGRLVRELEGRMGVFEWDGRDDAGDLVPSGLYFFKAGSGKTEDCMKLILLR